MKKWFTIFSVIIFFVACGPTNTLTKTPQQDKSLYEALSKLSKSPGDATAIKNLESAYADAVLNHQRNITEARNNNQPDKWERIMYEYDFLNKISDAVQASPAALRVVKIQRYDEQYAEAKQNAAESYYLKAASLVQSNNKEDARQAYTLLQQLSRIDPNYKDAKKLTDIADRNSVLNVVVLPVNYYAQSFGYWGLQNDYVLQEIMRELRFQLASRNVRVFTDQEARSGRIDIDRVIEVRWDQLNIPQPYGQTFTREVSKQVETGRTKDNQPIYQTVRATLYVTRREVQAGGNLTCRVTDANNQNLLWENFPADYRWVEEYATYRGDSRALGSYELGLLNNSRVNNNFSRRDIFMQVFRQVSPQLLNRIRSIEW